MLSVGHSFHQLEYPLTSLLQEWSESRHAHRLTISNDAFGSNASSIPARWVLRVREGGENDARQFHVDKRRLGKRLYRRIGRPVDVGMEPIGNRPRSRFDLCKKKHVVGKRPGTTPITE